MSSLSFRLSLAGPKVPFCFLLFKKTPLFVFRNEKEKFTPTKKIQGGGGGGVVADSKAPGPFPETPAWAAGGEGRGEGRVASES